jgi:hypothetical protein
MCASKAAKELAVKVVTSTMSATGTTMGGPSGGLVEFLAAQLDVAAELVLAGGRPSKKSLGLALAAKHLAISDLINNDAVQCVGSLASLGVSLAAAAACPPAGAVAAMATGLGALADLYAMEADCRPLAKQASKRAEDSLTTIGARFYREFWDWVASQGGTVPPL